jgi:hypothetical protein
MEVDMKKDTGRIEDIHIGHHLEDIRQKDMTEERIEEDILPNDTKEEEGITEGHMVTEEWTKDSKGEPIEEWTKDSKTGTLGLHQALINDQLHKENKLHRLIQQRETFVLYSARN